MKENTTKWNLIIKEFKFTPNYEYWSVSRIVFGLKRDGMKEEYNLVLKAKSVYFDTDGSWDAEEVNEFVKDDPRFISFLEKKYNKKIDNVEEYLANPDKREWETPDAYEFVDSLYAGYTLSNIMAGGDYDGYVGYVSPEECIGDKYEYTDKEFRELIDSWDNEGRYDVFLLEYEHLNVSHRDKISEIKNLIFREMWSGPGIHEGDDIVWEELNIPDDDDDNEKDVA